MPETLQTILWCLVGVAGAALIGWGFYLLINKVVPKIKNEKLRNIIYKVCGIMEDAVKAVYQTFVEALKGDGKFTKEEQEKAKQMATDIVMKQLVPETKEAIEKEYGDVETFVKNGIESVIYDLKN